MTETMNVQTLEAHPLAYAVQTALQTAARCDRDILEAEREQAILKAGIANEVLSATSTDGKPFYSNDKARDAAIAAGCGESIELQQAIHRADALRYQRALALADAEAYRNACRLAVATLEASRQ